ncbi:MAG: TolC family protein [Bacteroidales bacterium]|nr:TolC family protein [Bacteroidales bacterium]
MPDTLSFQEIFAITLQNNFQLLMLANDAEISKNNNTAGNAGFLPTVDLGVSNNNAIVNSKQKFYDGRTKEASGANNNNFNLLANLNWTVFDGMKMWATRDRLAELENIGQMNLQLQIEFTYLDLASLYFRLVQEQKLLQVLNSTLEVSRARLELAEKKFNIGAASQVDLNQARIDMSTDSTLFIRQGVLMKNLAADINMLAGRSPEIEFAAEHDILPETSVDYQNMYASMLEQNYSVLLVKSEARVKYQEIREKRAELMPSLSLYANYAYSNLSSETGLLETSTTSGPAFGFNFNYNLFNGLNSRRELQNSKIEYNSAVAQADEMQNNMHAQLYKTFNSYVGASQEVALEKTNLDNADKNLIIAIELYRAGAINEIEFRDIQRKALEAENRLLVAEYTMKMAGINLRQISGMLWF